LLNRILIESNSMSQQQSIRNESRGGDPRARKTRANQNS
jgi:hypothetical protein